MKKQHPIALLQYTSKNFWLLLIPLVRGLFAIGFDFNSWLNGAYLDVLVILLILGAALFRWWNILYEVSDTGITFNFGLFVKQSFFIPYNAMASVTSKRSMWLRPIKAVRVYIETDTNSALNKITESDVKMVVRLDEYKKIFKKLPKECAKAKFTYKAPKGKLLLFSFVFSSTLSGLIYFGTLLIQGGKLVDKELEDRVIVAVDDVTKYADRIIKGITPITVAFMIVIAAGWFYSFISNYLRHINFRIQRCGESFFVKNGFFSKWKYHINSKKVNYVDLRQNLLMKVCRVSSVHVSCSGYGRQRNEIPVFVPITTKKSVLGVMRILLPEFPMQKTTINPHWDYIMRFIGPPTMFIFGVMVAAFILILYFPGWYSLIYFCAIMGEILSVYLLLVKLTAFYTNGIGFSNNVLSVEYCRFYQFHHIIVPKEKITGVVIYQTIFQQMKQSCDFIVYTKGKTRKKHRIRGLSLADAEKIMNQIGYNPNCA